MAQTDRYIRSEDKIDIGNDGYDDDNDFDENKNDEDDDENNENAEGRQFIESRCGGFAADID